VSLAILTSHVNVVLDSKRRWLKETRKSYDEAFNRFLKMYLGKWTKDSEKKQMRAGVEGMRSVFHSFFDKDMATLIEAGGLLAKEDMAGFWDRLAVAGGSEALTVDAFIKPYRKLLNIS
jgi:hypothetical protein